MAEILLPCVSDVWRVCAASAPCEADFVRRRIFTKRRRPKECDSLCFTPN